MDRIKEFFKGEIQALKKGVTLPEYIFWWIARLCQVGILLHLIITSPGNTNILLVSLNLLASFTVVLVRLLLFPKRFFCKLPYRTQTWLSIMIFFGSFLGQGVGFNGTVADWDKVLHLMSGFLVVLMGNEIISMLMSERDRLSPALRGFTACGFSFIVIVVWEVYEFIVDYYWPGSSNQGYNCYPSEKSWFIAIFGQGAGNEEQWRVFDTNVDMFWAVVGAVPAVLLLIYILSKKEKKNALQTEKKEAVGANK